MKNYRTLIDALDDLRKRGYQADFTTQTVCLYCGDLDLRLNPEEFHVDEVYRFEADSNPGGSSVLYAISASTGVKGTLVNSFRGNEGGLNFEMTKKFQNNPAMIR